MPTTDSNPVSIAGWRKLKGDDFILRACAALHAKESRPKGALYCFRDVDDPAPYAWSDGYMVRDETNRRLLDKQHEGRHAAHAYGSKTLKMPPNDGETIYDVDCREGVTWADIRATDGLTHDELMAKLT